MKLLAKYVTTIIQETLFLVDCVNDLEKKKKVVGDVNSEHTDLCVLIYSGCPAISPFHLCT